MKLTILLILLNSFLFANEFISLNQGIPIGVKVVNRPNYDPSKNQYFDYYSFCENAIGPEQKKRKLIVENAYETNAYGAIPEINERDLQIALGLDFSKKYLEITLNDTLVKDSIYELEANLFLAQSSEFVLEKLSFSFLKESSIGCSSKWRVYEQDLNFTDSLIVEVELPKNNQSNGWFNVQFKYKASGGETFLVIGKTKTKKRKNKKMSLDYLNSASNQSNILKRYNQTFKKSKFYFLKNIKLKGYSIKDSAVSRTTFKYELSGGDFGAKSEFKKIEKFCINQEYELEGILFKDSLIDFKESINSLNDLRISIFYEFNSSVIQLIYKTTEKRESLAHKILENLEEYFTSNFDITRSRIKTKVDVDSGNTIKDTILYFEIMSF